MQDDTQPPTPPDPGAAGRARRQSESDRQARTGVAPRRPGRHLSRTGTGSARSRWLGCARQSRRWRAATGAGDDAQDDTARGGRGQQAQRKDRFYQWLPPFDDSSRKVLYENNTRMTGHRFSPDMQVLFFTERAGQNTVDTAVYLNDTAKKYTLARYRGDDIYANPGSIVGTARRRRRRRTRWRRRTRRRGWRRRSGDAVCRFAARVLSGNDAIRRRRTRSARRRSSTRWRSRPARRPASTKATTRTCTSGFDDPRSGCGRFIITRESPTEVPQQYPRPERDSESS